MFYTKKIIFYFKYFLIFFIFYFQIIFYLKKLNIYIILFVVISHSLLKICGFEKKKNHDRMSILVVVDPY